VRCLAEEHTLPEDVQDPSPVAGVQRKIALTMLEDGSFALPIAGRHVPSTHILKVPRPQDAPDVIHETAAAATAAAAGLDVALPRPMDIGGLPALLIERFDRHVGDGVVYRIHQEDFAQALGLPPTLKYERNGTADHRFDLEQILTLLDRLQSPALARRTFLRATLFNLAIGNTDNHAKNHALLYGDQGAPRLAPLYDLLPIRLNANYTHELAFRIGGAKFFDDLTPGNMESFFRAFGLEGTRLKRFVTGDIARLLVAIDGYVADLPKREFKRFNNLVGRELSQLADLLHLELPFHERDAFEPTGGGWTAS